MLKTTKSKPDFKQILDITSKYIFNTKFTGFGNKELQDIVSQLPNRPEMMIWKSVINKFLNCPKSIIFIDRYVNDFSRLTIERLLSTLQIFVNSKHIPIPPGYQSYIKASDITNSNFVDFKKNYILSKDIQSPDIGLSELTILYRLYVSGLLTINKNKNREGEQKDKVQLPPEIDNEFKKSVIKQQSDFILEIVSKLTSKIKHPDNQTCKLCPLNNKSHEGRILSNISKNRDFKIDPITIIICEDKELLQVYSEVDGTFGVNEYLIFALVLGDISTSDKSDKKKAIEQCDFFRNVLITKFSPKHIILVGSKVKVTYGIKGLLADVSHNIIDNLYYVILTAGSGIREGIVKYANTYLTTMVKPIETVGMVELDEMVEPIEMSTVDIINPNDQGTTMEAQDSPLDINPGTNSKRTLFNIVVDQEVVLYIYVDEFGRKIVEKKPYDVTVFVYNGNYLNCPYVLDTIGDNNVSAVQITRKQKQVINKLIK